MPRPLLFLFLFVAGLLAWAGPARAADTLPTRPVPFRFVNDEAQLLSTADAKKLEAGLRRYADNTGTQLVVLTVPTLGGRPVADYAREIGQAWGVGQAGKDNGLVLLLSAQERQVSIQAGAGLREVITPALVARVIKQDMTPSFRQNNYFAGLRTGLNTLMLAANPGSAPRPTTPGAGTEVSTETAGAAAAADRQDELPATSSEPATASNPMTNPAAGPEPASSGFGLGLGALAIGAVVIGGVLWLLFRLFKRFTSGSASAAAPAATPSGSNAPDFLPNQRQGNYANNNRPQAPDFLPNRATNSGGSGMAGMLMTGAAAAAGAYLGNRMATGHESGHDTGHAGEPLHPDAAAPLGYGTAGPATSGGFPALGNDEAASSPAPDYFSDEAAANDTPDYFSSDDNGSSSYDDPSSGDSGGGGFDDTNNNSGSW